MSLGLLLLSTITLINAVCSGNVLRALLHIYVGHNGRNASAICWKKWRSVAKGIEKSRYQYP